MSGINTKRVLLGGLAAAAGIMVFEFGSHSIVGPEWAAHLQTLGLPAQGEAGMFAMPVVALLMGTIAIWFYALAVPQLGARLETACIVGVATWCVSCLSFNILCASLGLIPPRLAAIGALVGLVQIPTSVVLASRIYRESEQAAVRSIGTRAA